MMLLRMVADSTAGQPSWGDLAVLGTYALAMIIGAAGVYRYQVLPERDQTRLERERTDREREERRESESRERKLAEAALPALQEAVKAMDQVSRLLDRQRT